MVDYIGNVHKPRLLLLSNQPKLLKNVELLVCKWYHCKYPQNTQINH
nr:MAG TPA: hypothetical protein [Caudoviricetes sp.]